MLISKYSGELNAYFFLSKLCCYAKSRSPHRWGCCSAGMGKAFVSAVLYSSQRNRNNFSSSDSYVKFPSHLMGFMQASLVWIPRDVFDDLFESKEPFNFLFGFLCFPKDKNALPCYHCGAPGRSLLLIVLTKPPDIICSPCCDFCLANSSTLCQGTRREHKHIGGLNVY